MIRRRALQLLESRLADSPAVVILGPRQVGKTTLALELASKRPGTIYLDLESPSDVNKVSDASAYFEAHEDHLIILDEVQRIPGLFPELRGIIDRRRRKGKRSGQFLMLGSAAGNLLQQSAESLAGRIAYLELTPLGLDEVAEKQSRALWIRGGFPDSFLAKNDSASLRWRQEFVKTYLERDIPQLGPRIPAETLRRFWTMLAHEQGQMLNASKLAAALAVSGQTITRYLDLMVDLMLVRRLRPFAQNEGKRLVRSPKVYVRDSGLVHSLLGLSNYDDVISHPVSGASFEGHVIENLLAVLPEGSQDFFYRTAAGAELDLFLELPKRQRYAIEIKRSTSPVVSKGFHIAAEDLKATKKLVVHAGQETYPLKDGVEATSLSNLQKRLLALG